MIITRFAPSPTGFLHIGSARTALFNWLYAKKVGGKFCLRIEDTDKARSTQEAIQAIIEGLKWLGLEWDDEIVMQSTRCERHIQIVQELIALGQAYYCYLSLEEIEDIRSKNPYSKIKSPWRDQDKAPRAGIRPVVRLRSRDSGEIIIMDKVQGEVKVGYSELDDMVLLRSDDSPTYMAAVVIDDHDMGVNFIIRGDDHLTNTFRQLQIYKALGWKEPTYAHIPLIHGADGTKLSKRHGALGLDAYHKAGYLPEAICNYLLRLGWGGDGKTEIISMKEAILLFDITNVSKSPARFDLQKLNSINAHYIAQTEDEKLAKEILNIVAEDHQSTDLDMTKINLQSDSIKTRIKAAIPLLKVRAHTLIELAEFIKIFIDRIKPINSQAFEDLQKNLITISMKELIDKILIEIDNIKIWDASNIKEILGQLGKNHAIKDNIMMQLLRLTVTGTLRGPGIYETIAVIGIENFKQRLKSFKLDYL